MRIRRYAEHDRAGVLALLQASLAWVPDEQYSRFFTWKHLDNVFGRSPAWVAVEGERVVGFRTFLRWDFERAGAVVRSVRAVDTATHPDYQGRGIFRRLTLQALEELEGEGFAFVFNTPNDQSRPGYLKMGWEQVGRLPVLARPRSPVSAVRLAGARVPAEQWSCPTDAGVPVTHVLDKTEPLRALLAQQPQWAGLGTHRTPAYLAWRYGFEPLSYRAMAASDGIEGGVAFFRLRRRGSAVEAAVGDVLVPPTEAGAVPALLRRLVRASGADYGVRLATDGLPRSGYLPVPAQGPTLVWRRLCEREMPAIGSWRLTIGDVELF